MINKILRFNPKSNKRKWQKKFQKFVIPNKNKTNIISTLKKVLFRNKANSLLG